MEMGKIGAWVSTNALKRQELAELARGVEDLGYDTLWYPESTTYESLAMGSYLLANSTKLKVASGIANI
ncbi:MAG: LLM class F420-dependent oxidoreductase, partial [Rhodospirillaceae bacterium]|nr:LLM class F420-dependent oxidoreductase [Rhodospirillaceae bacterium]